MICYVLVELNKQSVDRPYTYKVDFAMQSNIKVGSRVIVPFGNRKVEGFVLKLDDKFDDDLKSVVHLYNDYLNEEQMKLLFYLRKRNVASLIECVNVLIPPRYRASVKNKEKSKTATYIKLKDLTYKNEKHSEFINKLYSCDLSLKDASAITSTYTINKLVSNGIITKYKKEVYRDVFSNVERKKLYENATEEQFSVTKDILDSKNLYHLIYGPTGSGKTVCYLELINNTLKAGKQVIILVPEISLTPQYIAILKTHIDEDFAIFHSKLSSSVRNDQYRKVLDGKVRVAIGTRSSVFLPFTNLGLIIVDEEHDSSYIQESNVCYNTKEVASLRAKIHNAKLVMGSATPDVTTYFNALNSKIVLHTLNYKYGKASSTTKIINMKSTFDYILSQELIDSIKQVVDKNKQFILLLNKRGYVNYLVCEECGSSLECPNCSVSLKLHTGNTLKCHYCDYTNSEIKCKCGSVSYIENGYGIQKVEELLLEKLSGIKIERVDYDTVSKLSFLESVFTKFNNSEFDGLIGTQILSKGLDFKNVTLVAIIDADYALSLSNYRASESTFQYIMQSIGRSGRREDDALNIIQCFNDEHYAINAAVNQDYDTFYQSEIEYRKSALYPPFSQIVKVFMGSHDLNTLYTAINKVHLVLKNKYKNVATPSFSNIEKINNTYLMQIIVKVKKNDQIFDIIDIVRKYNNNKYISMRICINPISF